LRRGDLEFRERMLHARPPGERSLAQQIAEMAGFAALMRDMTLAKSSWMTTGE